MKNVKPYNRVWCILSRDANGNEGIVALNTIGFPTVCCTGDLVNLDVMKERAREATHGQCAVDLSKVKEVICG